MSTESVRWSQFDRKAPWRVRLISRLCGLLGVEIRVETRIDRYDAPWAGDDDDGWEDGLARTQFPVPRDSTTWRVEVQPCLYVRTAKDRAFDREMDRIARLPESAWHKPECPIAHRDEHIRRVFETGQAVFVSCTCDDPPDPTVPVAEDRE